MVKTATKTKKPVVKKVKVVKEKKVIKPTHVKAEEVITAPKELKILV